MNKYAMVALALSLSGCGSVQLIDGAGTSYSGKFDSVTHLISGNIGGREYSGFYVVNDLYGSNIGRAILRSNDGDTLQCEFNYQGYSAIGTCLGSNREQYQLIAQL